VFEKLKIFNSDRERPENPGGAFPVEKLPLLVAQRVVNGDGELPWNNTDREFWARFGRDFKRLAKQDSIVPVRAAVQNVFEQNQRLRNMLSKLHFEFCKKYGVRPAP
jgi:hypothetical protein